VLKVSAAQESVVVSMEAPAINTEDQTISQTIDNLAVIELPRDSRNVYTFLYLNPNVTQVPPTALSNLLERRVMAPVFLSMGSAQTAASLASPRQASLRLRLW